MNAPMQRTHPLFDPQYYLENNPDVAAADVDPFLHFMQHGAFEGRKPNAYFDPIYYYEHYPDVAAANANPLVHYVVHGAAEGRNPSRFFDTKWYASQYPDVAASGKNPLAHFLECGRLEGRQPHPNADATALEASHVAACLIAECEPTNLSEEALNAYRAVKKSGLFSASYYLQSYPDIASHESDPLLHFMLYGAYEGRNPNPWFHTKWYNWQYADIARTRDNALLHYLTHGAEEGRDPSPWFNTISYLVKNPGLLEAGINPLSHYLASGVAKIPDSIQRGLLLQDNAGRIVKSPELTDLIDFPARSLSPQSRQYDPSSLNIHWLAPDYAPGGGGSMTMFRVVRLLEDLGHRCTVWITRPTLNRNEKSAAEVAIKHYQTIAGQIKFLSSDFFTCEGDALMCTSWETVTLGMHATGFKDRFYFVQDYEPAFFARGARSLAAEWTYSNDIACICASPWLAETLSARHGCWTRAAWLAADTDVYRPIVKTVESSAPRIAFYARRYTERRAVDLGLLALEQLANGGRRFHVDFFGASLDLGHLPYSFTDHGILSEEELAKLYQDCDIGVVFSSTNYSLVPQEMMACGLPVLELACESTRRIYPGNVITLAGPHPVDIAGKLASLLDDEHRRKEQAEEAINWVRQFSWSDFAQVVEEAIRDRLCERGYDQADSIAAPSIKPRRPKASVLIPTYNAGKIFERVLGTVKAQKTPWPFEIIVIDSESTDGTATFAQSQDVIFRSIPKREFQHGRTRNLGIEMAAGEYVAILTHDALPFDESWLFNMITVFEKYPNAAGAFGRHIAYPDASPFLKRDIANHFTGFEAHPLAVSKYTHYRNWASGDVGWRQMLHFFSDNNSCVRKSVWNSIPYPNIEFGEDQVWAMRIIDAGYEKLYAKSAAVFHSHNYTPEERFRQSEEEGRFFRKYFGYECVPVGRPACESLVQHINDADEQWAAANGISDDVLSARKQLNYANIFGLLDGMLSTEHVGYQVDPTGKAA